MVTEYLDRAGLSADLDALGFNTGGLWLHHLHRQLRAAARTIIVDAIEERQAGRGQSVLSGNRNFEGRVSPNVRANYLASPPLVVAYALLGNMREDITTVPLGDLVRPASRCTCATSGRPTRRSPT